MGGDTDRLVHHDHVVIFVDDRHVLGERFRLFTLLDYIEFDDIAFHEGA